MAKIDVAYHELCREILREGYTYMDESRGIMCKQISSYTLEVDQVFTHFPLMTTKKMFTKGIIGELIWFLRGDDNIKYLLDNNIKIWSKDTYNYYLKHMKEKEQNVTPLNYEEFVKYAKELGYEGHNYVLKYGIGRVGKNYGVQWRDWTDVDHNDELKHVEGFDQIDNLIKNLQSKPMSRRHIVTAWNPAEINQTALPPCHWAFEIIPYPIADEYKHLLPGYEYFFDLKWHQRSVDTFLGLPFNITSYALLMRIIGEITNMLPNKLIGDLTNVHFYEPHIELVEKQLQNNAFMYGEPNLDFSSTALELFELNRKGLVTTDDLFKNLHIDDITFSNYDSYPAIEAEMYEPKK